MSIILQCNKLPLNFDGLKDNKDFLNPHSICRSGIWEWLSWVIQAQGHS